MELTMKLVSKEAGKTHICWKNLELTVPLLCFEKEALASVSESLWIF